MKTRSLASRKHVTPVITVLLLVAAFSLLHTFPAIGKTSTGGRTAVSIMGTSVAVEATVAFGELAATNVAVSN